MALAGLLGAGQALAAAPFVDNGNGTVTDTSTGLMWDQCSLGQNSGSHTCTGSATPYRWVDAQTQAATVQETGNYKGYGDWRVPNVTELQTLIKNSTAPIIDSTVFPNTPTFYFWTATTSAPDPSSAWVVSFEYGYTYTSLKAVTYYVRLVRSGQSFGSFGISRTGLSGISNYSATLTATSPVASTGYWLVVPRLAAAPLAAEIMAGVASYRGVTVAAKGNAAMLAATPKAFAIGGLIDATNYDLYVMAKDTAYATTSDVTGPLEFSTAPLIGIPLLRELTLTGAGNGTGLVSASGDISCFRTGNADQGTCSHSYESAVNVTLTATPGAGSTFDGWSGACSGNAPTCSLSMGSARSVGAIFANPVSVTQIVLDPTTPSTLYSSLDGGGVYKKIASADWAAINAGLSNLSVKALAIKADASRLFAGTDGSGVFYGDGSGSWAACPNTGNGMSNLYIRSLTVAGSTLYAGTSAGVFVSTDGCASWAALNTGMP